MRLLLVEDDQMLADGIRQGLVGSGDYVLDHVHSAEAALDALTSDTFDLAIVDIGLPQMDGVELTQCLRDRKVNIPVLMLTARDATEDRVRGLDMGADDYLGKPFELPELKARLRALLRRSQAAASAMLWLGDVLSMDTTTDEVYVRGERLDLGRREKSVLHYLLLHAPRPVNKQHLQQTLTGWDRSITLNAVEAQISRLRLRLKPYGIEIRSIRGFGYQIFLRA